ncbi:TetR/AcrR family transcriptional regulator [Polaromonas sp. JS666]|uniref:TetR/AcrR family transcriptional regulator n=1 Tax=Polaromonas sp. (strain JS666 / ATCC BAA-500) TaxID=296591 RepID=UPI0000464B10|nr:TetR/AcrR family transcriptional regulator [Polaromonas sp. JS666]ABE45722.1 transcriptional regulator, TetR family [Polaromonas sp. JS666]
MPSSATSQNDAAAPRGRYHHGSLREAMVAAALELIEAHGVEHLSVREAARTAGVSPGAPFRHFPTKAALLTAVAEQATERLHAQVELGLANSAGQPALLRFAAIGEAYLDWAARHPTHFQVVSQRQLLDADAPARLAPHNDAIRAHMQALLDEAFADTPTALARLPALQLLGRALVYGLSRMGVDGHFPEWDLGHASAPTAVRDAFVLFIELLATGRDAQTREAVARWAERLSA